VSLADRFRARLAAGRRPLALAGPRPRLALPAPPRRRQDPPELPLCPRCRTRHEPRPHPTGGRGLAAAYGRRILPDPTRPEPLGRQADETPLVPGRFRPWSP
jgi:hypothetical protein